MLAAFFHFPAYNPEKCQKKIAPMCDQLVLREPKQPLAKLYHYESINFNESNH